MIPNAKADNPPKGDLTITEQFQYGAPETALKNVFLNRNDPGNSVGPFAKKLCVEGFDEAGVDQGNGYPLLFQFLYRCKTVVDGSSDADEQGIASWREQLGLTDRNGRKGFFNGNTDTFSAGIPKC